MGLIYYLNGGFFHTVIEVFFEMFERNKSEKLIAFEAVVNRFEASLIAYACSITNNEATAKDVIQNTFIKFIHNWKCDYKITPELTSWLFRVAHNEAVDFIRKESRLQKLHLEHGRECIAQKTVKPVPTDAAIEAANALKGLSEKEREVVALKVYEEMSYKEISEITGLSEGNVGFILHTAMKKLAGKLKGRGK